MRTLCSVRGTLQLQTLGPLPVTTLLTAAWGPRHLLLVHLHFVMRLQVMCRARPVLGKNVCLVLYLCSFPTQVAQSLPSCVSPRPCSEWAFSSYLTRLRTCPVFSVSAPIVAALEFLYMLSKTCLVKVLGDFVVVAFVRNLGVRHRIG